MTDRLAHVKDFLVDTVYNAIGMRKFIDDTYMDRSRRYLNEYCIPRLHYSIWADDNRFDVEAHAKGRRTDAPGTAWVEAFVRELERDKETLERVDPGCPLYRMIFEDGQMGSFYHDLCRALQLDNPQWRAPKS